MHHLIQHGKVRSQVINVPEGFPELLSDITREVLRCQPTTDCLCQFVTDYLHSIMLARDKARIAKSIIDRALRTVDEIIGDMCICAITKTKADQMCEAMEECFRRFLAQRRCEKGKTREIIKFNEFDMLDELIRKCKFSDDELKISRPVIEAAYQKFVNAYMSAQENTDGTESLYQYFREREIKRSEDRLREEAAIKIQSNFRGFLVRKSLFMDKPSETPSPIPSETKEDLMQKEKAARKIQQYFRRHMSLIKLRKEMEQDTKEIYSPASKVSLASHPADFYDIKQIQTQDEEHLEEGKYHNDESQEIPQIDSNVKEHYTDTKTLDENKGQHDKELDHNGESLGEIEPQDDLYDKEHPGDATTQIDSNDKEHYTDTITQDENKGQHDKEQHHNGESLGEIEPQGDLYGNDYHGDATTQIDSNGKEHYTDTITLDENKGQHDKEQHHNGEALRKIAPQDDLYENEHHGYVTNLEKVKDEGEQEIEETNDQRELPAE